MDTQFSSQLLQSQNADINQLTKLGRNSPRRMQLLVAFHQYVFNELPTHLLRVNDHMLLTREMIRETLLPEIMAIPDEQIEGSGHPSSIYRRLIGGRLKFAILSHRWGKLEPSFQDVMALGVSDARKELPSGPGFDKLAMFCKKAKDYGCDYAWSDTCCINKDSSAELEEAIRSMFRWYRNAHVCIAHLAQSYTFQDFRNEEWFTRGWTLQELLAPWRIRFYGKDWEPLRHKPKNKNDKEDADVLLALERVTRIPINDIGAFSPGWDRVYEKMTWVSQRGTTKVEDAAYSLIGIFDVTMSIAYGEGAWAFHRLMEAILQRSGEFGILAWAGSPSPYSDAFPGSPACYGALGHPKARRLYPRREQDDQPLLTETLPLTMTKDGLQVDLLAVDVEISIPCGCEHCVFDKDIGVRRQETEAIHNFSISPRWNTRASTSRELISVLMSETYPDEAMLAVGVVNCGRTSDGRGVLRSGVEYLCLLLARHGTTLLKEQTRNALTFCCDGSVLEPLTPLCLRHDGWIRPSSAGLIENDAEFMCNSLQLLQ
ncbi:HET-domain-containing protein [Gyrodon lividus]|nr:HET-domain-containing protein [Gyrodon lividus]